ncbi:hypothetical protein BC833DRAFT_88993 [Globomyces pollinis-pini]|nr:hypothetical protein BC833DRAFT_88993 [Globomyces pollinis-pini]
MQLNYLVYSILSISALADTTHKRKCHHKKAGNTASLAEEQPAPLFNTPPPPPAVLSGKPCKREGYQANTQFLASYENTNTEKLINADFQFEALRPTVNLRNFPMINKVECGENDIKLNFDLAENAKKALDAWSKTQDMALFIGHDVIIYIFLIL